MIGASDVRLILGSTWPVISAATKQPQKIGKQQTLLLLLLPSAQSTMSKHHTGIPQSSSISTGSQETQDGTGLSSRGSRCPHNTAYGLLQTGDTSTLGDVEFS